MITTDFSNINQYSDKAILEEIGNFIKTKRAEVKISQDDLAERCTISRSTLSLIERGESITLLNLIKILRVLDALYVLQNFKIIPQISPLQLAKEEKVKYKRIRTKHKPNSQNDIGW
ncbi:MAG: helix-turn-helix transcriptional regulator [Bacteroidia bacterium]|nr:helix-turn-helix transcriptional regulator [Bacteroidia bacterium]MCZ2141112.1 helix-turn-helix transcriptional regulator [Bacteroidia bacterium]